MTGIDLFDLWNSFQSYVNTYIGGWFRPQTDFVVAVNNISNELWEELTKKAEKSQEARDNLLPFLKSRNMIVKSQNSFYGTFLPSTDYGRYASARMLVAGDQTVPSKDVDNGKVWNEKTKECVLWQQPEQLAEDYYDTISETPIENIDNQRWSAVTQHKTKKPTFEHPKMTQIDGGFKVAPRQVAVVILDYYTPPVPAAFVYTNTAPNVQTGAGDNIVYDKKNSQPLQWTSTMINEFLVRLGERYGIFTRDEFMALFTNKQKTA